MKKMGGKRFNGNRKVKHDGDTNSRASDESHTFKAPPIGEELNDPEDSDSGSSCSEEEGKKPSRRRRSSSEEDNADNALSDEERDAEAGVERPEMDDEDVGCPDQVTFELEDLPVGGTVDVKGKHHGRRPAGGSSEVRHEREEDARELARHSLGLLKGALSRAIGGSPWRSDSKRQQTWGQGRVQRERAHEALVLPVRRTSIRQRDRRVGDCAKGHDAPTRLWTRHEPRQVQALEPAPL
jgi:hypothetical protein